MEHFLFSYGTMSMKVSLDPTKAAGKIFIILQRYWSREVFRMKKSQNYGHFPYPLSISDDKHDNYYMIKLDQGTLGMSDPLKLDFYQ